MIQKNDIKAVKHLSGIIGGGPEILIDIIINQKNYVYYKKITKGNKTRLITVPAIQYKNVLKTINKKILQKIDLPFAIKGGRKKMSIYLNAKPHCCKEVVATMDIKDFFPSIHCKKVHKALVDIGFTEDLARLITTLTMYNGALPQGFPTSSALANIVIIPMAKRFQGLADKHNLEVSFWVDDITVSGSIRVAKLKNLFRKIIVQKGFAINEEKTIKIMKNNGPQYVTNLIANNDAPKVNKAYRKNVRAEIHSYKIQKEKNESTVDLKKKRKSIIGKITYIRGINKAQGDKLKKQMELVESK